MARLGFALLAAAAMAVVVGAIPAQADTFIGYQLPEYVAFPGGTAADNISTHNAFSAYSGIYFIGFSGIRQKTRTEAGIVTGTDGAAVIGIGFGRPSRALEVSVTMADISEHNDFFPNLKIHFKNETKTSPAWAVGMEDVTDRISKAQAERSAYITATKSFWSRNQVERGKMLFARTVVSLGWGTGRFDNNPFGSVSTSLTDRAKGILEYDGRGVNAGLSIAPMRSYPGLVFLVAGQDLNHSDIRTVSAAAGVTFAGF
jgi:hypothetical protein